MSARSFYLSQSTSTGPPVSTDISAPNGPAIQVVHSFYAQPTEAPSVEAPNPVDPASPRGMGTSGHAAVPPAAAAEPGKRGTAEIAVGALLSQARRASEQGDEFSASLKGEWAAALEGRLRRQRETPEEKAARVRAEAEARVVRDEGEAQARITSERQAKARAEARSKAEAEAKAKARMNKPAAATAASDASGAAEAATLGPD